MGGALNAERSTFWSTLASLLFGRFSSPTNIHTHSSELFTLN